VVGRHDIHPLPSLEFAQAASDDIQIRAAARFLSGGDGKVARLMPLEAILPH
jgi:hypothetical protein